MRIYFIIANINFADKPVCITTTTIIVGAAINEATKVACEVDAFPPPKNFQWTLNNSMGTLEIEAVSITLLSTFICKL